MLSQRILTLSLTPLDTNQAVTNPGAIWSEHATELDPTSRRESWSISISIVIRDLKHHLCNQTCPVF